MGWLAWLTRGGAFGLGFWAVMSADQASVWIGPALPWGGALWQAAGAACALLAMAPLRLAHLAVSALISSAGLALSLSPGQPHCPVQPGMPPAFGPLCAAVLALTLLQASQKP